jgi:O-antigen/teichoic acid export membrane protein
MLFLFARISGTIIDSILVFIFANRKFPYIKEKAIALPSFARKKIWSNVSILFFRKLGVIAISGMDFLIISAFVGIEAVGIYSNYALIIGSVTVFCGFFVAGADASIGNAIATLTKAEIYVVFRKMAFLIFCICGLSTVCFINLLNPFIELWIGKDYLLSDSVVYVIAANFFFMQNRGLVATFRNNAGNFRSDMYKPIIEVVFNLGLSIFLVRIYGVLGVLIGTLANTFFVCIWVEAYIAYKNIFAENIKGYLKIYAIQTLALLISCVLTLYINNFVEMFIGKIAISVLVTSVIYLLFFFRTEEFKYFIQLSIRYVPFWKHPIS